MSRRENDIHWPLNIKQDIAAWIFEKAGRNIIPAPQMRELFDKAQHEILVEGSQKSLDRWKGISMWLVPMVRNLGQETQAVEKTAPKPIVDNEIVLMLREVLNNQEHILADLDLLQRQVKELQTGKPAIQNLPEEIKAPQGKVKQPSPEEQIEQATKEIVAKISGKGQTQASFGKQLKELTKGMEFPPKKIGMNEVIKKKVMVIGLLPNQDQFVIGKVQNRVTYSGMTWEELCRKKTFPEGYDYVFAMIKSSTPLARGKLKMMKDGVHFVENSISDLVTQINNIVPEPQIVAV